MKSTFQFIASLACVLALTACGGAANDTKPAPVIPAQPAFSKTDVLLGSGTEAVASDLVTVLYTGWLYDESKADKRGTLVESSAASNAAFSFAVGTGSVNISNYLLGWDQGVVGMKVGGKRTLVLPYNLAFGSAAVKRGAVEVPAYSPVVYDIELVNVKKASNPPQIVLPVGLSKVDTKLGTGAEAVAGKTLRMHYTGWLYDSAKSDFKGSQFDTSVGKSAFEFKLGTGAVIAGWDQGIPGMRVGGKRTLVIPASLAYGAAGKDTIPGNATLLFEVELLEVK